MRCQRCGKDKKGVKPLCHACGHRRSGAQLFELKRQAIARKNLVQQNWAKAKALKTAMRGMSAALDRFFNKKRGTCA